jgi:hypothetical protein
VFDDFSIMAEPGTKVGLALTSTAVDTKKADKAGDGLTYQPTIDLDI